MANKRVKFYFQYPERLGDIYSAEADETTLQMGALVNIKELDCHLQLHKWPNYLVEIDREEEGLCSFTTITAKKVCTNSDLADIQGNGKWGLVTKLLIAAGEVNTLASVVLTKAEYDYLANGGLDKLKRKIGPYRAANLLHLEKESWNGGSRLELQRTGCCP